jgi:cytochrome P450
MVEYDPFSEAVMADPYPIYRRMRDEAPLYFCEKWNCWALSRFEDVWNASMDAASYSTEQGTTPAQLLTRTQPVLPMLNLIDPPRHTKLRTQVAGFFTPRAVARLEPQVQGFVDDAVAGFREKGGCDAMGDFGSQVSVKTACLVNGIPLEDGAYLNRLVWRFFAREEGVTGMTEDGLAAAMELNEYFLRLVGERRRKPAPEASVLSALLEVELDGAPLPDADIASHLSMLIIGGSETFPKTFANALFRLHQHPAQRAEVAAAPGLVPDAFMEALRYDMPTQFLGRTLLREVTLHGHTMKRGQVALFLFPSANRDDREFPDPDRFDVKRRAPRILSFGHGTHACLGQHVARLEARLCLAATLRFMPEYEVETDRLVRLKTEFVQGFASLPLRFAPF